MVAVCLHVTGVDFNDEVTMQTVAEHFAELGWGTTNGIPTVTIYTNIDSDPTSEVVQVARKIECRLKGSKVRKVYPDLVNTADIAHRVGLTREAVRKWTKREGFPTEFDAVAQRTRSSMLWQWRHVAKWLQDVQGIDMDEDYLDDATVAGIDACLAGAPSYHDRVVSSFAGMTQVAATSGSVPLPAEKNFMVLIHRHSHVPRHTEPGRDEASADYVREVLTSWGTHPAEAKSVAPSLDSMRATTNV